MNLGSFIYFLSFPIFSHFFPFFLILSGWCSGSPVGCFMWFGSCSASILILRSRVKAIGRCSKPIRYYLLSFVIICHHLVVQYDNDDEEEKPRHESKIGIRLCACW